MDRDEFIEAKEMSWVDKKSDSDDFWGGVDTIGSHPVEIFMTSSESGPTERQIEVYENFTGSFKELEPEIDRKCRELIPLEEQSKFDNSYLELLFVNVHPDNSPHDFDLIWWLKRGWFLFGKKYQFFVQFKNNQISNVEIDN